MLSAGVEAYLEVKVAFAPFNVCRDNDLLQRVFADVCSPCGFWSCQHGLPMFKPAFSAFSPGLNMVFCQVKVKLLPVVISVIYHVVVESPSLPTGEKTKDEEDLGDQPQTSETVNSICSNESAGAPKRVFQKDGM